jgi:malate permease and related proteins
MNDSLLSLAILVLLGFLWRYIPGVPDRHTVRKIIGTIVLNILLPALSFKVLFTAKLDSTIWQVPVSASLSCLGSLCVAWLCYEVILRFAHLKKETLGALLLASAWGNITYLGLPVVTSVVGSDMQKIPLMFDLLSCTPLLWSVGAIVAMKHSAIHSQEDVRPFELLKKSLLMLVKLPPFVSACVGVILNITDIELPSVILQSFTLASGCVAPLMMMSIGMALGAIDWYHSLLSIPAILIKLFFSPLIVLLLAPIIGLAGRELTATVLESAMPTMMLTMVLAEYMGLDTETLAQTIAISTACAFLTLPLFV